MPGTTPGGLPYPVGTDHPRDGDNAIQALATALDPSFIRVSATDSRNVATGTFTFLPTPTQDWVAGSGFRVDASGPITDKAGTFLVVATVAVANAAAGTRRVIGVSSSNGTNPGSTASATSAAYSGGATAMILNGSWVVQYAAGSRFALWLMQDSATTLAVTTRSLAIHRLTY